MVYVKKVSFKEEYLVLPKDLSFETKDMNLIVGDQGCGKSTLLKLLRDNSEKLQIELTPITMAKGVNTYYFDTESMNPRIQDLEAFTNPNGSSKGIGMAAGIMSRFQSHGEVLREFTVNRLYQAKNCVMFFDEPEAALSLKNQYKLAEEMKKAIADRHCQFFVATHCLPLILAFDDIYDLENKCWVRSSDYIDQIRK